jgi:hypothetical protein
LIFLRVRRRKIYQERIVGHPVTQQPTNVSLLLCAIYRPWTNSKKNCRFHLKISYFNNIYLKCETVVSKQVSIWNVCDMKTVMKVLGVVDAVFPQYDECLIIRRLIGSWLQRLQSMRGRRLMSIFLSLSVDRLQGQENVTGKIPQVMARE